MGRSGLTRSMRQCRSGPGSPDHIRTSFPDQFFLVTNRRADAYNRCILQFRQSHRRRKMLRRTGPTLRVGRWILERADRFSFFVLTVGEMTKESNLRSEMTV